MRDQFTARCERVRQNNGIVEVFFTRTAGEQDEHFLMNIVADKDQYKEGELYWIAICPAWPQII